MPNIKILVVDDLPDIRLEVNQTLKQQFDVTLAESGEEALEFCREQGPFAVVISDQGMPGMSGVELLAQMRMEYPDTVRIMMSGYADLDLAIAALKEGALFRFMQKPFRPQGLLEAVQAGVERFQWIDEQRFLTKQLEFSRTSLLSLTESLELRLANQLGRMAGLQRFCLALSKASSLESVAELTAQACSKLLGDRAVEVCLVDELAEARLKGSCGGPLEGSIEQVSITSGEGEVGEIRMAVGRAGALNESERVLLASLAGTAAISANLHLLKRSRDMAHDATIFALSNLAEKRDEDTAKHMCRVGLYSEVVAKSLRSSGLQTELLSDAYIKRLKASAALHDIGKAGIPDSILLKPGPLTESEWELMRSHTEVGSQILCSLSRSAGQQSFLFMAHEIAWGHHERWDGAGYPRALHGTETPLSARIVAVADCYDALTSWRPYKDAWSHEEAMAYIADNSGTQFDPSLASALIKSSKEVNHIRESLADTESEARAKRAA